MRIVTHAITTAAAISIMNKYTITNAVTPFSQLISSHLSIFTSWFPPPSSPWLLLSFPLSLSLLLFALSLSSLRTSSLLLSWSISLSPSRFFHLPLLPSSFFFFLLFLFSLFIFPLFILILFLCLLSFFSSSSSSSSPSSSNLHVSRAPRSALAPGCTNQIEAPAGFFV